MVIGSMFALILGKISSKIKRGNLVLVLGSFAVIIVAFVLMNNLGNISIDKIQNVAPIFNHITNIYFITSIFLNAVEEMNLVSFLVFIAINTFIFTLFVILFAKSFRTINATMNESYTASKYKISRLKESSTLVALYKKK